MVDLLMTIENLFGVQAADYTIPQMLARAVIIYLSALTMMRLGERRMMGKNTAFDLILGVVLGSMLSRAINGSADLVATVVAGAGLVTLHWLFAWGAWRSGFLGKVVKGRAIVVIEDGRLDRDAMKSVHITERDIEEAARRSGHIEDIDRIAEARLERSGEISVIPKPPEPKVIRVDVADGVQTVHIALS